MKSPFSKYQRILLRKSATVLLVTFTALGAFAALGDGKIKDLKKSKLTLTPRGIYTPCVNFSLKSDYQFRGAQILNEHSEDNFINLNTNITYQKGNTTYIMPIKKKVILDKVKFSLNQYNSNY